MAEWGVSTGLTRARVAVFAGALSLVFVAGGFFFLSYERGSSRAEALDSLKMVTEIKARALAQWRAERRGEMDEFARSPLFSRAAGALVAKEQGAGATELVRERLELRRRLGGYEAVFLATPEGELLAAAGAAPVMDQETLSELREAAKAKEAAWGDFFQPEKNGPVWIDALAPVRAASGAAVLVERSERKTFFNSLLSAWPSPSKSAELLLMERSGGQVRLLDAPRLAPGPPRSFGEPLAMPFLAEAKELSGLGGPLEGMDDRGKEVLAHLGKVPDSPWFIVAKVDKSEALAGADRESALLSIAVAGLVLCCGFGFSFIHKAQGKKAYKRLYEAEAQRAKALKEGAAASARFEGFMKSLPGIAHICGMDGRYVYMNEAWEEATGLKREDCIGKTPFDCFPKEEAERLIEGDRLLLAGGRAEATEMELRLAAGPKWWLVNRFLIEEEENGQKYAALLAIDVTGRKAAEARAARITRLYKTLSEVNQALIRTKDRKELLQETCRIIVEQGGFRMAWTGFMDEKSGQVVPEASAGHVEGYLGELVIRGNGSPAASGPTGRAFKEKRPVIFNDCLSEPAFAPWRDAALARGYRASCALPVIQGGKVTGLISVYAAMPNAFGEEEARLLEELAADAGYSLAAIEERAGREVAQARLARAQREQAVLNNILRTGLEEKNLAGVLQDSLNEILAVPWLELSPKGAVFVTEGNRLVLRAQTNMPEALLAKCEAVAPGECLCGRAFSAGEIVFSSNLDERHETAYEGIVPHGHYCVPVISAGEVKGVLCLYVKEGHEEKEEEREALLAISNALSGIICRKQAEQKLKESEEKYRSVLENMEESYYEVDLQGNLTFFNDSLCRLFGYPGEELMGMNDRQYTDAENAKKLFATFNQVFKTGEPARGFDWEVIRKDGSRRCIEASVAPRRDAAGATVGFKGIVSDVTDRRKAEESALRLSRFYQTLSKANELVAMESERASLFRKVCQALVEEGGFRMAWAGERMADGRVVPEASAGFKEGYLESLAIRWDDSPEGGGPAGRAIRERRPVIFNDCLNDPDYAQWREAARARGYRSACAFPVLCGEEVFGTVMVYGEQAGAIGDEEAALLARLGQNLGYAVKARGDESRRRAAEEALRESEEKYRSVLENMEEGYYEVDLQGNLTFFNEAGCRILGYPRHELMGMNDRQYADEYTAKKVYEAFNQVFMTGEPARGFDWELIRKDGAKRIIEASISLRRGPDGSPVGFRGIILDVTEEKRAKESLKASEEQYRAIFEGIAEGVFKSTPDGKPLMVNPALVRMLGYHHAADLLDRDIEKEGYEDISERRRFKEMIEKDGVVTEFETRWRRADGSLIDVVENARCVRDESGRVAAYEGTVRDVTELKHAERALRQSEEMFRSFFENNPAASYISAASGQLMECNEAFLALFGFGSKDEALKASLTGRYAREEERQSFIEELASKRRIALREATYKRVDESPVHVIETVTGIFGPGGELNGAVGFLLDVTDKRALEAQLLQAQKMEAVGQLAAGIAHDFNNVLMAIQGASELLAKTVEQGKPGYREVVTIQRAAERAALVTKQLLGFARKTVLEPVPIDPNELVAGLLPVVQRLLPETIRVEFIGAPDAGFISADKGQMGQVLMNLCVNAKDAMPRGGTLTIELENVLINGSYVEAHPWAKPGRYVLISVTDTGTGIKPEILGKIFDPFFTTKPQGKGTGLGLSMAYGIVKQHDGMINAYSEPGVGTTFKIYLPMMERRASAVGTKVAKGVEGGHETLLVVEDDKEVRNIVVEVLMSLGYKVLYASDGAEGLKVLRNSDRIDLVITDIVMPKMGGKELREATRRMNPSVRFIFTSGYTENVVHHDFILDKGVAFLSKPYGIDVLARKVREILDRREEMRK